MGFWLRSWDIVLLGQPGTDPSVLQFLSHPLTRDHPVLWVYQRAPLAQGVHSQQSLAEVSSSV